MRHTKYWISILTAALLTGSTSTAGEWIDLFNEKDLTNWENPYDWGKAEVVNGELHLSTEKSKWFLSSTKKYSDFIFEAEVKMPEGKSNSGFLFRSHKSKNKMFGYQAEVDPSSRNWSGGLYDEGRRRWFISPNRDHAESEEEKKKSIATFLERAGDSFKRDEWNHYRIECRGDHIKISVNGVITTDIHDSEDAKGYIALQHHGEDGQIYRFRNIKIMELTGDHTPARPSSTALSKVHMANGIKVGEVDSSSAIVWTRLTQHPERNTQGKLFEKLPEPSEEQPNPDYDLEIMQGSVLGKSGEVQVRYWPKENPKDARSTQWQQVDAEKDYIHQFQLKNLRSATDYELSVIGRDGGEECVLSGRFRTAPTANQANDIRFVATTCGDYPRRDDKAKGHKIYPAMLELKPDFFVHTGDIEYYDKAKPYATNLELARFKWNRIYSMPYQRNFHKQVSSYFIKDDHDTLKNDAWPGQTYFDLTWEQGLATFREQVPMGEKTYRTIRWGKDLQIWLVEGRDFRSPNRMPDGPEKTIWGEEQKQWFFETVSASDATFKVLLSPTPIVGPDRENKNDNHANKRFTHEGDQIRQFIAKQSNMFIICGDRHWQYASIDPDTGIREFSCGPGSNFHKGGYREEWRNEMHRYLRIQGGFLSVDVNSAESKITFNHHEVDGSISYTESFPK